MSETARAKYKYKTTNWREYNASLVARGSLSIYMDANMHWWAPASGKPGRPAVYSDEAIQCCLSLQALLGLPLRQARGLVQSLLKLMGLHWSVPDFSTLSRRSETLQVKLPCRCSVGGLHLLVDSTGMKFLGEGEWKRKKHGAEYRRQWRKVHLAIDAQTLEIRAIEVTSNDIGDAPMLGPLLGQIPSNEVIASVTTDGAYDTQDCHEVIAARAAQAVIPPRKNARLWKKNSVGARVRNEAVRACRRLGRSIWKKWSGYHRRSLVETKMHCLKRLGERVTARTFARQVVQLQIRAGLLNRFSQMTRPCTVAVPAMA